VQACITRRRRRTAFDRLLPALLFAVGLLASGCPVTTVAGNRAGQPSHDVDPGPPEVLNPSLLDRG